MKQPEIIITNDGSHTLFVSELNEHYHSTFGAINESQHIFIDKGLKEISVKQNNISILEIGFGTGLNAFLTGIASHKNKLKIQYRSIEKFPLSIENNLKLNYPTLIENNKYNKLFEKIIYAEWNNKTSITNFFEIEKQSVDAIEYKYPVNTFDLVYFDAFSPDVQPELWTEKIFQEIYFSMKINSIFVTYSSKGSVKRALKSANFNVQKIPGPVGKREIVRAIKN